MGKKREMKKSTKIALWITMPIVFVLLLGLAGTVIFLKQSYKAVNVDSYLTSNTEVNVSDTKNYIFFDSPSDKKAIIMYGGANVEEKAYSPICRKLADTGYDVFILKTFEEFALFDVDKADTVLNHFSYENVSLMGHSLGGVAATNYLAKTKHKIDNLIYLASFSNIDISSLVLNVISVQGALDGVISKESLAKSKAYMPSSFSELWIEGGNHAQFGSYGKQAKDNDATITLEEQTNQTCGFILNHIV